MIQEKTRGNLSNDEATVLKNTLSNLQMIYVEVAQSPKGVASKPPTPEPEPERSASAEATADKSTTPPIEPSTPSSEGESKKKFTKSYGS